MSEMRPSYVYLLATEDAFRSKSGPVKVGFTGSIGGRIAMLQTGSPHKLTYVHIFGFTDRDQALEVERRAHRLMGNVRMTGEWFNIDWPSALRKAAICAIAVHEANKACTVDYLMQNDHFFRVASGVRLSGDDYPEALIDTCFFMSREYREEGDDE